MQLVVALNDVQNKWGIERLIISTYQSLTGTGQKAVRQYEKEKNGIRPSTDEMAYAHPIFENCIPHCDVFLENDYTREEMKLVNETRKIFDDNRIKISATAVRIPVIGGHSESVNVELANEVDIEDVIETIGKSDGVVVVDEIWENEYPMPLTSHKKDDVFVGRIRKDISNDKAFNCWIVSDNLRKGAATNAVQIAEKMTTHWSSKSAISAGV